MMLKLNDYKDNLTLSVVWEDEHVKEVRIEADTQPIKICQNYYMCSDQIIDLSNYICGYCDGTALQNKYISGPLTGQFIPAFSFLIEKIDNKGHMYVALDLEIDDVDDRSHYCKCFIKCELGQLYSFGKRVKKLSVNGIGTSVSLTENL